MKQLILILISCLAFAQPQKPDTAGLAPEVKAKILKIEIETRKADQLDQKLQSAEKEIQRLQNERSTLLSRLKGFFKEYFGDDSYSSTIKANGTAVKEDNRTDPVEEIEVYDGSDTIRGGWVYRLFHKNDYYLKRYKFQNNEKVYLD